MRNIISSAIIVCFIGLACVQTVIAQPTSSSDAAIRRKFGALGMIWQEAQGQEPGTDRRKELLTEFLDSSKEYFALLPQDDKSAGQVWTFRVLAACELGREDEAKAAGAHMQELGLDKSENPLVTKALAFLERKHWLVDPKAVRAKEEAERRQFEGKKKAESEKPRRLTQIKIATINSAGRFVVLDCPNGKLPAPTATLLAYRDNAQVAELKVTGPQNGNLTTADIISGACQATDEVWTP